MTLEDLYEDLVSVVSEAGALVDVPIESEAFFRQIVESFQGTREECLAFIQSNLPRWFRCLGPGPDWIQEAEWQFANERPMVFLGQVDVPASAKLLHDDARVFVFLDGETAEIKTIMQIA